MNIVVLPGYYCHETLERVVKEILKNASWRTKVVVMPFFVVCVFLAILG